MFLVPIALQSQHILQLPRTKVVHGIVIDGTNSRGISNVYVRTSSHGVISEPTGKFSLPLSRGDSLHFSHVGYLPYKTIFNGLDNNKFVIVLSPKITFLKEVTVTSTPTEIEFRNKVLETIPQLSMEEEIAEENVRIMNQAVKFAVPLQMDSYQSYRDYMKGPQGVVILSSSGSKGLVRAIKNVIRSTPYKFPSFVNRKSYKEGTSSVP